MNSPKWVLVNLAFLLNFVFVLASCQADDLQRGRAEIRRFLTTWLVNGNIEAAAEFLTTRAKVCTPSIDTAEISLRPQQEAKAILREGLRLTKDVLGTTAALGNVIRPIPSDFGLNYNTTMYEDAPEFSVLDAPFSFVREATCGTVAQNGESPLIIVAFMFRVNEEQQEAMYFIFQKEADRWRIISFDRFKQ